MHWQSDWLDTRLGLSVVTVENKELRRKESKHFGWVCDDNAFGERTNRT
jgi:hypothetical protein